MKENATFKVGKFTVHVDYYEGGGEVSNSIHVSATRNGKDYWADITELTHQSNEDGSRWLPSEEGAEVGVYLGRLSMTAAQWKRVDQWLTAEEHY